MREDDMGKGHAGFDPNGKAITKKTFEEAAKAFGMSVEDTKKEVYALLKEDIEGHSDPHDHPHQ